MEKKLKNAEGRGDQKTLSSKGPAAPKSSAGPNITPSKGKSLGKYVEKGERPHSTGAKANHSADPKKGMPRKDGY